VRGNPYYANLGDAPERSPAFGKHLHSEKITDPAPEFLRDRMFGHIKIAQILTRRET